MANSSITSRSGKAVHTSDAEYGEFQRNVPPQLPRRVPSNVEALEAFQRIRQVSCQITSNLVPEDCVLQSMADASPIRWHLAHTTWFFETFVLRSALPDYRGLNRQFEYLFNSYYNTVGDQFPRSQRGMLSRPTVAEVGDYRAHVDREVVRWLAEVSASDWEAYGYIFQIGLQHEQQHQELMLTDIKHAFSKNPLFPSVYPAEQTSAGSLSSAMSLPAETGSSGELLRFLKFAGGVKRVGCNFTGADDHPFCYDNESPRHDALLTPFELGDRLITNREYLQFIQDGGYQESRHWLSAGWATVQHRRWCAPLYWHDQDGQWCYFTLGGIAPIDWDAPVAHISYYEADAYARWAGLRLPTEFEWEVAAESCWNHRCAHGSFLENRVHAPRGASSDDNGVSDGHTLRQMFGELWEWTASPYVGYPGYRPPAGAIGEYNGKFMSNQMVLRGGSLATSHDHIRPSYRNFFPPDARWQFSGLRLAK